MERRDAVLKGISRAQKGIEIGPWFNPLASKAEGYQCLVLDVFDLATLRQRATDIANVPDDIRDRIEEVDLLGSSTQIEELVRSRGELGQFDYIVSSHNFEHLPDPIRFLQGCAQALKPGGLISMAIPDKRSCFDYFRPVSTLGQWIEAYECKREKPTSAQYFDLYSCLGAFDNGNGKDIAFHRGVTPDRVSVGLALEKYYAEWLKQTRSGSVEYLDTHCSVFTPSSFELLIRDLGYLGLCSFEIVEVFDSPGVEFYGRLRKADSTPILHPSDYEAIRNKLLRRILEETAESSSARSQSVELIAQNTALKNEIEDLRQQNIAQNAALSAEVERLRQRNIELERQSALKERELFELRASTSWRLTSPLRRAVTALRK
ncbi:SAM-dependent methyltransferase/cell division protein FtsB [Paraburkholderia sp. RAU6.4a]|uniref:methyltransferase domain-containing protein n=1 Tax=Paraburkholderia sp. RAU6.4a TaxID=2991067 RepID=UPI003D238B6B